MKQSQKPSAWYANTEASQIVELAVSLPLLVLMVVGVMDFGSAFNLKHKLDIGVQQAARVASVQPMADITNAAPRSTEAVRQAVDSYLASAKINDCGLATASSTKAGLAWTYQGSNGCSGTLVLTVDRGTTFRTAGGPPMTVEATRVSISYPFQWRFGRVVQLIAPGTTFAGTSLLTSEAIAQNLN